MTLLIDAHPPAPPPASVTALQARRALRQASAPVEAGGLAWAQGLDLRGAVEAYVDSDPTGDLREEWDFAISIERASPFIEDARVALQLSAAQMDDLFRLAGGL